MLPDERGATCAGFLRRARAFFAEHGIRIQRVLTDNAFAYRHSAQVRAVVAELGAIQRFTRPLSTPNQRQGRAVQPHAGSRMGPMSVPT